MLALPAVTDFNCPAAFQLYVPVPSDVVLLRAVPKCRND